MRPSFSQPKELGLDLSDEEKKKKSRWKMGVTLPSASNILALLIKNWITMKRNPVLLIFIFFLPGIFMVLTCISIGIDPVNLPFGVLNLETNCSGVNLSVSKIFSLITMMYEGVFLDAIASPSTYP